MWHIIQCQNQGHISHILQITKIIVKQFREEINFSSHLLKKIELLSCMILEALLKHNKEHTLAAYCFNCGPDTTNDLELSTVLQQGIMSECRNSCNFHDVFNTNYSWKHIWNWFVYLNARRECLYLIRLQMLTE